MKALFFLFKKSVSKYLIVLMMYVMIVSCSQTQKSNSERFVVLSPEVAEIMYYLGVSDKIIGVTLECDYPSQLQQIEKVGNFGQVSLEKILALNPDIVFTTALEQEDISVQLNKMNIKTIQLYPSNINELFIVIDSLASVCNAKSKADSLKTYLSTELNYFKKLAESRDNKPKVFIEIYGDPIMSASNDAYLGQLLLLAGAENIFPSLIRDYARVSAEEVVRLNPEIIILTYPGVSVDDVKNRKGWSGIDAIKNNMIFTVDDIDPDLLLRAGPRNIAGIKSLIELLYKDN